MTINNGIKEPTHEYVKVRESLYTRVIIWVKTILNHIGSWRFYLGMKGSCVVDRLE